MNGAIKENSTATNGPDLSSTSTLQPLRQHRRHEPRTATQSIYHGTLNSQSAPSLIDTPTFLSPAELLLEQQQQQELAVIEEEIHRQEQINVILHHRLQQNPNIPFGAQEFAAPYSVATTAKQFSSSLALPSLDNVVSTFHGHRASVDLVPGSSTSTSNSLYDGFVPSTVNQNKRKRQIEGSTDPSADGLQHFCQRGKAAYS